MNRNEALLRWRTYKTGFSISFEEANWQLRCVPMLMAARIKFQIIPGARIALMKVFVGFACLAMSVTALDRIVIGGLAFDGCTRMGWG